MSLRLAPGQKVEEIAPEVERLLRAAAPGGCGARDRGLGGGAARASSRPIRKVVQLGLDAFERASAGGRR